MKPRSALLLLSTLLLLLPVFAHAQGDDWTFHAPPLSDGIDAYNDGVFLMTGWTPPNVISPPSYSEAVGWDEVDGITSFDVILAVVNGYRTTIYATHGLYTTMADFEYHFSSEVGLLAADIDGVVM